MFKIIIVIIPLLSFFRKIIARAAVTKRSNYNVNGREKEVMEKWKT